MIETTEIRQSDFNLPRLEMSSESVENEENCIFPLLPTSFYSFSRVGGASMFYSTHRGEPNLHNP